jgi:hypothetical protein
LDFVILICRSGAASGSVLFLAQPLVTYLWLSGCDMFFKPARMHNHILTITTEPQFLEDSRS